MLDLTVAIEALARGGVIAYPTESVYGLGCDPFNPDAVNQLLALKKRDKNKGFILIADTVERILPFIQKPAEKNWQQVLASWPGPVTWCLTPSEQVPSALRGEHPQIAIRVSAHPLVQILVKSFGKPIISTSANFSSEPACTDAKSVKAIFSDQLAAIIEGDCGGLPPTKIINAITLEVLRA